MPVHHDTNSLVPSKKKKRGKPGRTYHMSDVGQTTMSSLHPHLWYPPYIWYSMLYLKLWASYEHRTRKSGKGKPACKI